MQFRSYLRMDRKKGRKLLRLMSTDGNNPEIILCNPLNKPLYLERLMVDYLKQTKEGIKKLAEIQIYNSLKLGGLEIDAGNVPLDASVCGEIAERTGIKTYYLEI